MLFKKFHSLNVLLVISFVVLILLFWSSISSAGIIMISNVNSGISNLEIRDIVNIYMRKSKQCSLESFLKPVTFSKGSKLRVEFTKNLLGMSVGFAESRHMESMFKGGAMPPYVVSSESEMIDYIVNNKLAIGYVSSRNKKKIKGVRVIGVFE